MNRKKSQICGIIVGLASVFLLISGASAYGYGWSIKNFQTDITINKDSSILVKETIAADYTNEEHHGITRLIPVKYRDKLGNQLNLRYSVISITDEKGTPWNYEQSQAGDNLNLQIGNADIYLNKISTFVITYQISRVVTYFADHDELYWNSTGTEWDVPIYAAKATITLPAGVKDADLRAICFTGAYGTSSQNCTTEIKNGTITYTATTEGGADQPVLNPREGLTIGANFPKGIVEQPGVGQQAQWFLTDNWGYLLPILTFIILYYLWRTRGRDPKTNRDTIMPIYTPPDKLTPSEVGTIIDEKVDMRDISSCIIDLAVRGYIKISETKSKTFIFENTKYEFERLKDYENDTTLKEHERKIMKAIFNGGTTRSLDDLTNKFYKDLPGIKDQIYKQLTDDGYFPTSPEKVRTTYFGTGMGLLFVTMLSIGFLLTIFPISLILGVIGSAIIIIAFANFMPAKTKKGVDTYYQIKGLEEYISTAEKDRIKFQEKENIFEKLLPYAMTLGIAAKWTEAFAGVYKTPPSWYTSTDPNFMNNFNTMLLFNRLNLVSSSMQTSFTSSPRSAAGGGSAFGGGFSGGGFSGGGFGGGGGSSW